MFANCSKLTSVTIPDSVATIDSSVFYGCFKIISISFEGTIEQWNAIEKNSNWDYGSGTYTIYCTDGEIAKDGTITYYPSEGLEFTLNDDGVSYSVTDLGICTDTDIVIPSTYEGLPVTAIGTGAFTACYNLTSVKIPDSVIIIGNSAFAECYNLASVEMGNSVTIIGDNAFYYCDHLESVTISDSLTTIGDGAYYGCTMLVRITISDSVTAIGFDAFYNCYCAKITFEGTVSQWNAISEGGSWNSSTAPQIIRCTDGEIAKDGTVTYY